MAKKARPEVDSTREAANTLPVKVAQPHGGALYAGGVPGNRGGYGRPARVTVRQAHEDLPAILNRLRGAAQNERTPVRDLVAIARLLIEVAAEEGVSERDPLPVLLTKYVTPEQATRALVQAEPELIEHELPPTSEDPRA